MEVIRKLSGEHSVKLLCKVLKVPRSKYYGAIKRSKSRRTIENEILSIHIKDIWLVSKKIWLS